MASAVLRSTTVWRLLAQRFDRAVEGQTVALSVSTYTVTIYTVTLITTSSFWPRQGVQGKVAVDKKPWVIFLAGNLPEFRQRLDLDEEGIEIYFFI